MPNCNLHGILLRELGVQMVEVPVQITLALPRISLLMSSYLFLRFLQTLGVQSLHPTSECF